jgi:hypothetical protein
LCCIKECFSGRATIRNKSGIPLFKNYRCRCSRNEYSARSYRRNHLQLPVIASVLTDECDPDNLKPVIPEIIAIAGQAEPK